MFCLALLVSDPKATSRCLQSLGRAALSVKCAAEIPVCQFKWHSPSSDACVFKSAAKCGKQGMCSYPLWREQVSGAGEQCNILERPKGKQHGGFLPLLSSINLLAFFSAFAACWLPRALTARQTSKYSISIAVQQLKNSIAGEGGSYSSPSHLWCRGVYLSLSSPQALNVHHGQGFCSSQAQILAVAKYVTDGSSEKQLLEVLACYFTSKRYEGSYQKKKKCWQKCAGGLMKTTRVETVQMKSL